MLATPSASLSDDAPTAPTGIGLGAPTKAGEHGGLSYLYSRGWKSSALPHFSPSFSSTSPLSSSPSLRSKWPRLATTTLSAALSAPSPFLKNVETRAPELAYSCNTRVNCTRHRSVKKPVLSFDQAVSNNRQKSSFSQLYFFLRIQATSSSCLSSCRIHWTPSARKGGTVKLVHNIYPVAVEVTECITSETCKSAEEPLHEGAHGIDCRVSDNSAVR